MMNGFDLFATKGSAEISACGRYRWSLWRKWANGKPLVFVMLNPSTADAVVDDPTVRRCMGFAKVWGYGSLRVVNLFALRATDPQELYRHPDPVGSDNNAVLVDTTANRDVVVAWGMHGDFLGRGREVFDLIAPAARSIRCLGTTGTGQPKHPLFLTKDCLRAEFSYGGVKQ